MAEINNELLRELIDIGDQKTSGEVQTTWEDIAAELNTKHNIKKTESWWRKLYKSKRKEIHEVTVAEENIEATVTEKLNEAAMKMQFESFELSEQRRAVNKQMKNDYRRDSLLKIFEDNIKQMEPPVVTPVKYAENKTEIVAMLSDIHYGLEFDTIGGKYNSAIAAQRLDAYADSICNFSTMEKSRKLTVVILGDLISGLIHRTLILENREDIVEQCIGVARIISTFLGKLYLTHDKIDVWNVSGNHSRLDSNMEECLRTERLDDLVMHMVRLSLSAYSNIEWHINADPTAANFKILNKNFVAVHGDYDKTTPLALTRLSDIYDHIDYLLMGHMHVCESRFDKTAIIRNGCVCGSGDDYSMKKRLFAPPMQTVFSVDKNGIKDIRNVRLDV